MDDLNRQSSVSTAKPMSVARTSSGRNGADESPQPQGEIIRKALSLFTDKHSVNMVERHVKALERIQRNCSNGYFLCDVSDLCPLLAVCMRHVAEEPQYRQPMCGVVRICRNPFLKHKLSDEVKYAPSVVELISLLGRMVELGEPALQRVVAEVVAASYSEVPDNPALEGLQVTKLSFNAAVVEKSGIAACFVGALFQTDDLELNLCIMKTLRVLSSTEYNCNLMLSALGGEVICKAIGLDMQDPQRRLISCCTDTLWNILEKGDRDQIAQQLSCVPCISVLRDCFKHMMLNAVSRSDRQLRNDLLVVCTLVASLCPDAPFVETKFLKELCLFATFSEVNRPHEKLVKGLQLLKETEDFELKKLLMCLLLSFTHNTASLEVINNHMVLLSLFSYVVPNEEADMHWSPAQFEELQLLALSVLSALAPKCPGDYITCQGSARLLIMLEWCLRDGIYGGYGNSFHGDGGRGTKLAQLRHCLHVLVSMVGIQDSFILEELCDQGILPILTELLEQYQADNSLDMDSIAVEVQTDAVMVLSFLCEQHMHIKELFGESRGIEVLIHYLRMDVKKFGSGLGHQRLLVAVVDCIWSSVICNFKNEDLFLENEGIFLLLDLLEVCPNNMQSHVLGVIVDLCENLKAVPHVTSWRGSKSSSWSLMAHLWRSEEADISVSRGHLGTLEDMRHPLMGAAQRSEQDSTVGERLGSSCVPPSIRDVTDNLRARIFSLCSKIGFQYCPHDLPTEDKVTLYTIERYMDFKTGEVWEEVSRELEAEGVEPVSFDHTLLQEISQITEAKAEQVLEAQCNVLDKKRDKETQEEEELYEQIKHYNTPELRAEERFEDFLRRTSDYQYLKANKLRREREVDASRTGGGLLGERFHSTEVSGLNTSALSGRSVTVATTPMKLTSSMGVDYDKCKDRPVLATWKAAEYGRALMGH